MRSRHGGGTYSTGREAVDPYGRGSYWDEDDDEPKEGEQLFQDWERRWDVLPFVCWMIFVFAGCAITNPGVMALKKGCSVGSKKDPPSSSSHEIRLSDHFGAETQAAGAGRGVGSNIPLSTEMENEGQSAKDQAVKVRSGQAASSRKAKRAPPQYGYHTFAASRNDREGSMKSSKSSDSQLNLARREAVRQAFKHAWSGYETHAFGHDEVRPTTNETNDSWGGFGVTLFDSLDTMLLMGLDDEYGRALDHVRRVDFDRDYGASFFETAIRYLGGLLGAHALRPDPALVEKARDLGERLLLGFHSTKFGLPQSVINLETGASHNHNWNGGYSILAEVGSIQLEFAYLSHITKDNRFYNTARKVFSLYESLESPFGGLFPVYIDADNGGWGRRELHVTMGGLADSFYEYLLKLYILTGMKDRRVLGMYNRAVDSMIENLVVHTTDHTTAYLAEFKDGSLRREMEHLSCFVPGMLALGAKTFDTRKNKNYKASKPLTPEEAELRAKSEEHMRLAGELLLGCVSSYEAMMTELGPERFEFDENAPTISQRIKVKEGRYILRPETMESIFVLYRTTGNQKYREMGWRIFEAMQHHCKTECCYTGIVDVQQLPAEPNNSMQSFFLAETLKYLYLLFSPEEDAAMDEYVWTTEAHPLPIFKFDKQFDENGLILDE